jgi:hypothetical protein
LNGSNAGSRDVRSAVIGATLTAAAMIAFQVGAKATRDAFFLSVYPIRLLPAMMAATAMLAVALAYRPGLKRGAPGGPAEATQLIDTTETRDPGGSLHRGHGQRRSRFEPATPHVGSRVLGSEPLSVPAPLTRSNPADDRPGDISDRRT